MCWPKGWPTRDGADWGKTVTVVEKAARDLRLTFPQDIVRLSLPQIAPSSDFFPRWKPSRTNWTACWPCWKPRPNGRRRWSSAASAA
jgi:hypothetical protein